jgi:hypothetical protein
MSFRRNCVGVVALAAVAAGCSPAPLPQAASPDPADPAAAVAPASYQPVMSGTAAHAPVALKPWRELNDSVAPRGGKSP